jgi:hypothetical protein
MAEGTGWKVWTLTDQSQVDECADELYAQGYASDAHRGWNDANPPMPANTLLIHVPGDDLNPKLAAVGDSVIKLGSTILILSADDFAASPFAQG